MALCLDNAVHPHDAAQAVAEDDGLGAGEVGGGEDAFAERSAAKRLRVGQEVGALDAGQDVGGKRRGVPGAVETQDEAAAAAFEQLATCVDEDGIEGIVRGGVGEGTVIHDAVAGFVAAQQIVHGQCFGVEAAGDGGGWFVQRVRFDVVAAIGV